MTIGIVPLTGERIAAAAALEAQCFSDGVSETALHDFVQADANHYYAAEAAGELLGYGGFSLAADEAEIITVATDLRYRRCGIARALMKRMLADAAAQGGAMMYLDVRASNSAAIALYESLGFAHIGVRRGYYSRPREDAVLMQLPLTKTDHNGIEEIKC